MKVLNHKTLTIDDINQREYIALAKKFKQAGKAVSEKLDYNFDVYHGYGGLGLMSEGFRVLEDSFNIDSNSILNLAFLVRLYLVDNVKNSRDNTPPYSDNALIKLIKSFYKLRTGIDCPVHDVNIIPYINGHIGTLEGKRHPLEYRKDFPIMSTSCTLNLVIDEGTKQPAIIPTLLNPIINQPKETIMSTQQTAVTQAQTTTSEQTAVQPLTPEQVVFQAAIVEGVQAAIKASKSDNNTEADINDAAETAVIAAFLKAIKDNKDINIPEDVKTKLATLSDEEQVNYVKKYVKQFNITQYRNERILSKIDELSDSLDKFNKSEKALAKSTSSDESSDSSDESNSTVISAIAGGLSAGLSAAATTVLLGDEFDKTSAYVIGGSIVAGMVAGGITGHYMGVNDYTSLSAIGAGALIGTSVVGGYHLYTSETSAADIVDDNTMDNIADMF